MPQAKALWGVSGTDGSPSQHTREAGCSTQKYLFTPAGQAKETVIRTLRSIPCTQGTFMGGILPVSVFTLSCQKRWTPPWGFLSPRSCRKVPCHCSWWNRSYFSLCESQSFSVGFWSDIDTSGVAATDTNSVMSGKTNLPQVFHQPGSASHYHLQLAQALELVNPS